MSHFTVLVALPAGTENPAIGEAVEKALLPYMENCCATPPKEFMEFEEDPNGPLDQDTGKRGYWQNPNAKWDWFEIGGRWHNELHTKQGRGTNIAKAKDVLIDRLHSWAFVDLDGHWHEPGTMMWWAMNDATEESRAEYNRDLAGFLAALAPDDWLVLVDCHI